MDWGNAAPAAEVPPWEMDWGSEPKPPKTARETLQQAVAGFAPQNNERLTALGKGLVRGVTTDLPGIPMDFLANIADLARAGHGAIMGARGYPANQLPELQDRSQLPLTSDWFARLTGQEQPPSPDAVNNMAYAGGRMASGGLLARGAAVPKAVTAGAVSGAAAQGAAEAGLPPSAQILTSMLVPYAAKWGAGKEAQLAQSATDQATHDANIRAGKEAGLVFPPMAVNPTDPGIINRTLTGLAGQAPLHQAASVKNYARVAQAARDDLGIKGVVDGTAIKNVINQAGEDGYAPVKKIADIPTTDKYLGEALALEAQYKELASANSSLANPKTAAAIDSMFKDSLTGTQAVEVIKQLRADAADNLAAVGEPERARLGTFQKKIADTTERLVEEHLKATGQQKQYEAFVAARKKIAKSYSYLEAWDMGSGQIAGVKLRDQLEAGAPLSGQALKVAKAAAAVPDAFKIVRNPTPGMGWQYGALGGGGLASSLMQDPRYMALAALPYTRPAMRSLLLSSPYQNRMAKVGHTSSSANLLRKIMPEDTNDMLGSFMLQPYGGN